MRTPETEARAAMEARHAEYDARVDLLVAQIKTIDPVKHPAVRRLLKRLGGSGCMSGTPEFRGTVDALAGFGVTGANHVFHHDRQAIAATLPAKLDPINEGTPTP